MGKMTRKMLQNLICILKILFYYFFFKSCIVNAINMLKQKTKIENSKIYKMKFI